MWLSPVPGNRPASSIVFLRIIASAIYTRHGAKLTVRKKRVAGVKTFCLRNAVCFGSIHRVQPHAKSQLLKQHFTFPKLPQPYLPDAWADGSGACHSLTTVTGQGQQSKFQTMHARLPVFSARNPCSSSSTSVSVYICIVGRKLGIVLAHLLHHGSKFCATHPAFRDLVT